MQTFDVSIFLSWKVKLNIYLVTQGCHMLSIANNFLWSGYTYWKLLFPDGGKYPLLFLPLRERDVVDQKYQTESVKERCWQGRWKVIRIRLPLKWKGPSFISLTQSNLLQMISDLVSELDGKAVVCRLF